MNQDSRKRVATFAVLIICVGANRAAKTDNLNYSDEGPANYIVRVVDVNDSNRNTFINCLLNEERPFWQSLKNKKEIVAESVFQSEKVLDSELNVPRWNYLMVSHLAGDTSPSHVLQQLNARFSGKTRCERVAKGVTKRIEFMKSTPHCNYAREKIIRRDEIGKAKATYVIEYIAAKDVERYTTNMRDNIGPATVFAIKDGRVLSFLALETADIRYSARDMKDWNQIHIGLYTHNTSEEEEQAAEDLALRNINPTNGGYEGVYGPLATYRTKPREDQVKQLFELAVR